MKLAYLGYPGRYGLFSVYTNLRAGLEPLGIEVRWVGLGSAAVSTVARPQWAAERQRGDLVASNTDNFDVMGKTAVAHLIEQKYDAVCINPPQGRGELNIVRYLPRSILRLMSVQMMGSGTYRICSALRDHVHQTIGLSPRIEEDLIAHWSFDPSRTTSCAGIDLSPYTNLPRRLVTETDHPLRLLYFGRISEGQKGILSLPTIMERLSKKTVRLTVAGDGPDMAELRRRSEPLGDRITFVGVVEPTDIPALLARHDAFIFPTRYEGLGYVLLEALAAGCVPVCSTVRGVTDFIVRDGETGLRFPVDDSRAAAEQVSRLVDDRQLLHRLALRAVQDVRERFDASVAGAKYATILSRLGVSPPPIAEPLSLENWSYPRQFRRGWRAHIPERLKNVARAWLAR